MDQNRRRRPLADLKSMAKERGHHSLVSSLAGDGLHVIAEMKRASPSAGLLAADYDPGRLAALYRDAGAAGISVLTEPMHFMGTDDDLRAARAAVGLPILRKDFICDVYQVYESAAMGADVLLLIVAALKKDELARLNDAASECGLDVLVESHTESELETSLLLENVLLGINSRDLKTLKTDLSVARRLARMIPPGRTAIAESGIRTRADMEELRKHGYRGFLVGEALMRGGDPGRALRDLLVGP